MPDISIPERNKQVKALLQKTYPNTKVSVKAGRGTAHRWIEIAFGSRVEATTASITTLIKEAGIYVSSYAGDSYDCGGDFVIVYMPPKPRS